MKITQIPMGAHNAQLTCYLQDPCTEMPAGSKIGRAHV